MFNKPSHVSPQNAKVRIGVDLGPPHRQGATGAPTIIAADLAFEGRITGQGALQVDGRVKGDVDVARLLVTQNGVVEGTINGQDVDIRGRVIGSIKARSLKLTQTAHVEGNIWYEQLCVEADAQIEGHCQSSLKTG